MAKKFTYMWAIIIDGNFMKGKIFCESRENAMDRLLNEMKIGLEKVKKTDDLSWHSHSMETDKQYLRGVDGCVYTNSTWADDWYLQPYITYKISKVRVPV